MRFIVGLLFGLLIWPLGVWCYLRYGHPPVAVADKPMMWEKRLVHIPLHRRIDAEMPKSAPIQPTPDNLLDGARNYSMYCAGCHGSPNAPSDIAAHMYPHAPQLWQAHGHDHVVGVSDDPPGETYWKVENGIRLTGMPSFKQLLKPDEIWQVSILLANANKPMPQPVLHMLSKP